LHSEIASQAGEKTKQENRNGEISADGIAHSEEEIDVFEQPFESGVVALESLTAHNGPQNVDDRDDEDSLEIDDAIVVGLSLLPYFVDQISDFVHHLILDGRFAKAHFSQLAHSESPLLSPKFSIGENHAYSPVHHLQMK
jgi:hypothetical protein